MDAHLFISAVHAAKKGVGTSGTAADYTVEHRPVLNFELGCGAVMPALEAAVMKLRVKGTARCRSEACMTMHAAAALDLR